MIREMGEKALVRKLSKLFMQIKPSRIKGIRIHTNLGTKSFKDIWSTWWESEIPPRLEVDFIFICEDIKTMIDNSLLIAVETKFFKDKIKSPYEGLQQALSFGVFGFDSLVLWHIFSQDIKDENIKSSVRATAEVVNGFKLPIVYVATKINEDEEFRFFYPVELINWNKADYFLSYLLNLCMERRNPLLFEVMSSGLNFNEIRKRRNTLKVVLKVPV